MKSFYPEFLKVKDPNLSSMEKIRSNLTINISLVGIILILFYGVPVAIMNQDLLHGVSLLVFLVMCVSVIHLSINKLAYKKAALILILFGYITLASLFMMYQNSDFSHGLWFLIFVILSTFYFDLKGGFISLLVSAAFFVGKGILLSHKILILPAQPRLFEDPNMDFTLQMLFFFITVMVIFSYILRSLAKSEKQLWKVVNQKDTLLKEVHHRVKNNLQIITSLLALESGLLEDEKSKKAFRNSQNRVNSMALIHELLYRMDDIARIKYEEYLKELVEILIGSFNKKGKIAVKINAQNMELNVDTAIPLGLLVNEIVTNSLKHAFPEDQSGNIYLDLSHLRSNEQEWDYVLKIGDDGIGMNIENHSNSRSLGNKLIHNLILQLGGKWELDRSKPGTHYTIQFREINSSFPD